MRDPLHATQSEARSEAVRLLREAERILGGKPLNVDRTDTYIAMAAVWAVLGSYGVPEPEEPEEPEEVPEHPRHAWKGAQYRDQHGMTWTVVKVDDDGAWVVRGAMRVALYESGGYDHLAVPMRDVVLTHRFTRVDVGVEPLDGMASVRSDD